MATPQEWAEALLQRAQAKSLGTKEVFGDLTSLLKTQNKQFFSLSSLLNSLTKGKAPLSLNIKGGTKHLPLDLKGMVKIKKSASQIASQIQKEAKSSVKNIAAAERKIGKMSFNPEIDISKTQIGSLKSLDKDIESLADKSKNVSLSIVDQKLLKTSTQYLREQKELLNPSLDAKRASEIQKNISTLRKAAIDLAKDSALSQGGSLPLPANVLSTKGEKLKLAKPVSKSKDKLLGKSKESTKEEKAIEKRIKRFEKELLAFGPKIQRATKQQKFDVIKELVNDEALVNAKKRLQELALNISKAFNKGDLDNVIAYQEEIRETEQNIQNLELTFAKGFKKALISKDFSLAKKILNKQDIKKTKKVISELEAQVEEAINTGAVDNIKEYSKELRQARTRVMELEGGFKKLKATGRKTMDLMKSKMGEFVVAGASLAGVVSGFNDLISITDVYTKQQFLLNSRVTEYQESGLTSYLARSSREMFRASSETANLALESFKLGVSYGDLSEIQTSLRSRIRAFGKTSEESSRLLGVLTEKALVASKVLGIDASKAVDIIERDMWKFGKTANQAGKDMVFFRDMAAQTNRTIGQGSILVDDFVNILDDASSSTTSYAQNTRFLSTIVRQHQERVLQLGASYNESIESAKELAKTLTTDTPELVKYQAGKIILDTISIGQREILKTLDKQRVLTKEEQKALGTNARIAGELSTKEKNRLARLLAIRDSGARDLQHAIKIANTAERIPNSLQRQQFIQQEIGESAQGQLATMRAITDMNLGTWIQVAVASGKSVKEAVEQYKTSLKSLSLARERQVIASKLLSNEQAISKIRLEAIAKEAGGDTAKAKRLTDLFNAESEMIRERLETAKRTGDDEALRQANMLKLSRSFGSIREKEEIARFMKIAMEERNLSANQAKKEVIEIKALAATRDKITLEAVKQLNELKTQGADAFSKKFKEDGKGTIDQGKKAFQEELTKLDDQIRTKSANVVLDFAQTQANRDTSFVKGLAGWAKSIFGVFETPLVKIATGVAAIGILVASSAVQTKLLWNINRTLKKGGALGFGSGEGGKGGLGGKAKGAKASIFKRGLGALGGGIGKAAKLGLRGASALGPIGLGSIAVELAGSYIINKTFDALNESQAEKSSEEEKEFRKKLASIEAKRKTKKIIGSSIIQELDSSAKPTLPKELSKVLVPPRETVMNALGSASASLPVVNPPSGVTTVGSKLPQPKAQQVKAMGTISGMSPNGNLKLEIVNFKDILGVVNQQNTVYR